LDKVIDLKEYNEDKKILQIKIKDLEEKRNKEKELEQFNFTVEDIMLKRDLESIKCLVNPFYQTNFEIKWDDLNLKEKQDLIMSYIESIEVIKKDKDIEIKRINFRKTFIEEYANLFNKGAINRFLEVNANGENIQIEVCAPMTEEEINKHVERLEFNYPVAYHEIKKEKYNDHQISLKYTRINKFNEPLKIIPILNKKGFNKIESYGVIEVPVPPVTFINVDRMVE